MEIRPDTPDDAAAVRRPRTVLPWPPYRLCRSDKTDRWQSVFVVGDPAYCTRFGFDVALAEKFETPYPKPYVMALELSADALNERQGAVIYPPPFLELE